MDQHASFLAQVPHNPPPSATPTTPASAPVPPPPPPASAAQSTLILDLYSQISSLQHQVLELRRENADLKALHSHLQTVEDVSAGWQQQCADLEALLAAQRPRTSNLEHVSNVLRAKRARLQQQEREGLKRLTERDGGLVLRKYERPEPARGSQGWAERLASAWEGLETPTPTSPSFRDGGDSAGLYGNIGEERKRSAKESERMVQGEDEEEETRLGSAALLEEGEAWQLGRGRRSGCDVVSKTRSGS